MADDRTQCFFTVPNGVPLSDQGTFDRLHHAAGSLVYVAMEKGGGIEGIGGTATPDVEALLDFVDQARWVLSIAEDAADHAVERAREGGATWQQIGDVFGTTRQAAQQRFGGAGK